MMYLETCTHFPFEVSCGCKVVVCGIDDMRIDVEYTVGGKRYIAHFEVLVHKIGIELQECRHFGVPAHCCCHIDFATGHRDVVHEIDTGVEVAFTAHGIVVIESQERCPTQTYFQVEGSV